MKSAQNEIIQMAHEAVEITSQANSWSELAQQHVDTADSKIEQIVCSIYNDSRKAEVAKSLAASGISCQKQVVTGAVHRALKCTLLSYGQSFGHIHAHSDATTSTPRRTRSCSGRLTGQNHVHNTSSSSVFVSDLTNILSDSNSDSDSEAHTSSPAARKRAESLVRRQQAFSGLLAACRQQVIEATTAGSDAALLSDSSATTTSILSSSSSRCTSSSSSLATLSCSSPEPSQQLTLQMPIPPCNAFVTGGG